ncbi:MAG: type 1 glutamine amidotransferase [Gammaproteobacteria bacterium]|nr:type 1 glutamine amidotransferase [Gammaproteobacteria bacterium]
MLPVCIICHADCEPAGYLCDYFERNNIAYKKVNAIQYQLGNLDLNLVSSLVFMGGPHSVNDDLPWLSDEINLIQQAIDKNIPMMGVCLGAQLISKALGAEVITAENMETGWHQITVDISGLVGNHPFETNEYLEVFEWHEDTFALPEKAVPLFKGLNFDNQGYLYGNILTMQFHLEMNEDMIYEWLQRYHGCMPEPSDYVQSPEQITAQLTVRLENLHRVADRIYHWWINMVKQS